jgi:hypothetical protein
VLVALVNLLQARIDFHTVWAWVILTAMIVWM